MKTKLLFLFVVLFSLQINAQTLNPTLSIATAGTADTFKGGYTFAYPTSGTPWAGPLISFGGFSNNYDCQLNSNYSGNGISYRTRNGDTGTWNAWNELATRGINTFTGNQTINGILNVIGNNALNFSTYGGGLYMSDTSWIRTYGNKNFYHNTGIMRTDGVFHVGPNGDRLVVDANGKVGIGTTSPTALLDLQKSYGNDVGIKLSQPGSSIWDIKNTASNGLFTIGAGGGTYFNIAHQTGNVGIGTSTTSEKLTVAGNILAQVSLNFQDNTKFTVTNANVPSLTLTPFSMPKYGIAAPNTTGAADLWISGNNAIRMFTGSNGIPTVNILSNKVGIGTLNPDKELTVNGSIHSKEVIVDTAIPADYVFQKYYTGKSELKSDYTMPTLAEIESFTKINNHLPNVPSAQEIQQNGLSLGEMSTILLQKVEELTLYAIEQQKEIYRLKTENENYKSLAERLSVIEKELKK